MLRNQVLLLSGGVVLIALLALLPKAVVKNAVKEPETSTAASSAPVNSTTPEGHGHTFTSQERQTIDSLQILAKQATTTQAKQQALLAVMEVYRNVNYYDSAAYTAKQFLAANPSEANILLTADAFFDAFNLALDEQKQTNLALEARALYNQVLENNPSLNDVRVKVGLTYVLPGQPPMQGIGMIRDVLKTDPNNQLALFQLGLLSVKSQQFDKAIGHLEKLIALAPNNLEARLYLGFSYMQLDNHPKAEEQFNKVKQSNPSPELLEAADKYLKELAAH